MNGNQFTEEHLKNFAFPSADLLFQALGILYQNLDDFRGECARFRFYNGVGTYFSFGMVCAVIASGYKGLIERFNYIDSLMLILLFVLAFIANKIAIEIGWAVSSEHLKKNLHKHEEDSISQAITIVVSAKVFLFIRFVTITGLVLALLHTIPPVQPGILEYMIGCVVIVASGIVYYIERKLGPLPEIPSL